jgi:hypothetical protein
MLETNSIATPGRYDDFFTPEALALQRSTPWNDFTALIRTMHTAIHNFLSDVLIEPRINGLLMSGPCLRTLVVATRALGRIVKFHNDEHPPLSEIADDIEEGTWMARRKLGIESPLNIWPSAEATSSCHQPSWGREHPGPASLGHPGDTLAPHAHLPRTQVPGSAGVNPQDPPPSQDVPSPLGFNATTNLPP